MNLQKVTLASVSKLGHGEYGIGAPAVKYSKNLYTYLRITDIKDDGTFDIVFARTGASTGRNYFYDGTDGKFVYAGFLIKFSIASDKVNPKFIKYYCMSDLYKGWIRSFNTGSTRGNINAQTLGEMTIYLPSRKQQDGMVRILSCIDSKIKNNLEINKNLAA